MKDLCRGVHDFFLYFRQQQPQQQKTTEGWIYDTIIYLINLLKIF